MYDVPRLLYKLRRWPLRPNPLPEHRWSRKTADTLLLGGSSRDTFCLLRLLDLLWIARGALAIQDGLLKIIETHKEI